MASTASPVGSLLPMPTWPGAQQTCIGDPPVQECTRSSPSRLTVASSCSRMMAPADAVLTPANSAICPAASWDAAANSEVFRNQSQLLVM